MTDPSYLEEHRAYLGTSGSGKSTTARGHVEQLLRERRHTCITDHTGVWYGLRSNAAGNGPGFDIPIFGGRRGDVPIAAGDGSAIGKIVGDGVSAIVDLSGLRTGYEQRVFMRDFVAALRAKPPGHFQFVADEADEDVPEKTRDGVHFELAEDMIWIAKRGRSDGYVLSLITQRTASIANEALAMAKTIFAHQLISPADTAAFGRYVKSHGTAAEYKEIMSRLPSLQTGERYIYSPQLHVLELGRSPLPTTFDSSRTPAPGETKREPRMLAQLDISAIAKALAKPREEAAIAAYDAGADVGQLLVEKDAQIRELREELADIRQAYARRGDAIRYFDAFAKAVKAAVDSLPTPASAPELMTQKFDRLGSAGAAREEDGSLDVPRAAGGGEAPPKVAAKRPERASPEHDQDAAATGPDKEYVALAVLVSVSPLGLSEAAWAARARNSRKGGAWMRRRKRYTDAGLIEKQAGKWFATPAGIAQVGGDVPEFPAAGAELVDAWVKRLDTAQGRILKRLSELYPQALKRGSIAEEVRMAEKGGAFQRSVAALKAAELLEERGRRLRVSPAIMGDD